MLLLLGIDKSTDENMLQKAIDIYVTKFNLKPQICFVKRETLSADFNQKTYHGVEIVFDDKLKLGDFALRVE